MMSEISKFRLIKGFFSGREQTEKKEASLNLHFHSCDVISSKRTQSIYSYEFI